MSRIGKQPITIPKGVDIKVSPAEVSVKGPKGTLTQKLIPGVIVNQKDQELEISVAEDMKDMGKFHGLYRALINNMVVGVTTGFEKKLEMIGVGYRAILQGPLLDVQVGLSHEKKLDIPKSIQVKVEKTIITISGANKQEVGQFAATVRAVKPPEPYQGKGIRYVGEYVRKKAGKAAAAKK